MKNHLIHLCVSQIRYFDLTFIINKLTIFSTNTRLQMINSAALIANKLEYEQKDDKEILTNLV